MALPNMFQIGDTVRHEKTKTFYYILETPDTLKVKINGDWVPGYRYRAYDFNKGDLIFVRSKEEMEDGRFEEFILDTNALQETSEAEEDAAFLEEIKKRLISQKS